jgi:hypothetical protein
VSRIGGLVQTEGGYVGVMLGRRVGRELRYLDTVAWAWGARRLTPDAARDRRREIGRPGSRHLDPVAQQIGVPIEETVIEV